MHDVKLPLGAREGLGALRLGHSLEIAERLETDRTKPEILNHPADLGGSAVERQEIILKDLHTPNCALAIASSFSFNVPLSDTVAIAVCTSASSSSPRLHFTSCG